MGTIFALFFAIVGLGFVCGIHLLLNGDDKTPKGPGGANPFVDRSKPENKYKSDWY